jgi:hypothetical protein
MIFCGLCKQNKNIYIEDTNEEPNSRHLDPYDDDGLIFYLKNGKHLSGLPKKQLKRIHKLSSHFKIIDDKLYYRKDMRKDIFLFYPPFHERNEILQSNLNLGHFATDATYKRILEKFFWRGLYKDVEKFVGHCLTCQRNSRAIVEFQPALAITADTIFDNLVVDTTWGYPLTSIMRLSRRFNNNGPFFKIPICMSIKNKKLE